MSQTAPTPRLGRTVHVGRGLGPPLSYHRAILNLLRRSMYLHRPRAFEPLPNVHASVDKRHAEFFSALAKRVLGRPLALQEANTDDMQRMGEALIAQIDSHQHKDTDEPHYPDGWRDWAAFIRQKVTV